MDGVNDKIMIALLPMTTDWSTLELPHLTLVFAGLVSDHPMSDLNAMGKDASSLAALAQPIMLKTIKMEQMGPPDDVVSAITLRPNTELMAMRNFVEKWNQSEFTEYKPHCTVGPYPSVPTNFPEQIAFNKIVLCWGNTHLTFSMQ